jgi:hypothetical protein
MPHPPDQSRREALPVGTRVEVRTRFRQSWSNGFEVAEVDAFGYWLRRDSDDYLLPCPFVDEEIRRES